MKGNSGDANMDSDSESALETMNSDTKAGPHVSGCGSRGFVSHTA